MGYPISFRLNLTLAEPEAVKLFEIKGGYARWDMLTKSV